MNKATKRLKKIEDIIERYCDPSFIDVDYYLDNSVSTRCIKYYGYTIWTDGGYESNRNGHTCLSYYRYAEDDNEYEWKEKINGLLVNIQQAVKRKIQQELEEKKLREELEQKKDELHRDKEEIAAAISNIAFKYDGSWQYMIIDGKLYQNDPELRIEQLEEIVIDSLGEFDLYKIKRFLESDWKPSECTLRRWKNNGYKIVDYFILDEHE